MSQPQGSRYQAPSFVGWLPQLSFIQWVAVFTLATVIAILPGIWTLRGSWR